VKELMTVKELMAVRRGRTACRISKLKWKMGKKTGCKKLEDVMAPSLRLVESARELPAPSDVSAMPQGNGSAVFIRHSLGICAFGCMICANKFADDVTNVLPGKAEALKGKDFVCSTCQCLLLETEIAFSQGSGLLRGEEVEVVECVKCTGQRFVRELDPQPGPRYSQKRTEHEREKAELRVAKEAAEAEVARLRAENECIKQQAAEHMPIEQRRSWWALWRLE
jgi:predicted DNA-binding protein (UPF0251 family)